MLRARLELDRTGLPRLPYHTRGARRFPAVVDPDSGNVRTGPLPAQRTQRTMVSHFRESLVSILVISSTHGNATGLF